MRRCRQHFQTTSSLKLPGRIFHISHIASTGWGNEYLCFLFRSDKNSGCYGNLKFPLTCMEKKWKLAFSIVRLGIFEFCFNINVN